MSNALDLPNVRGKYRLNADLSKMCWFQVGGPADVLFIPEDEEDLVSFLKNKDPQIPVFTIGVGSNILIPDDGIRGVVIRLGRGFNTISHDNSSDNFYVKAGAAALDLNVALYAMENSISDLEFLSGIPGTIGGALAMNAGAYSSDIASRLIEAKAVNKSAAVRIFQENEIGYRYRGNALGDDWIFISATLKGNSGEKSEISAKIKKIQEEREKTQPIRSKTCGSTFKNPPNMRAWELIKNAGLSGFTIGGASISTKHCNFIINNGNSTAADIEQLILHVKAAVYKNSGVLMEEEIRLSNYNKAS